MAQTAPAKFDQKPKSERKEKKNGSKDKKYVSKQQSPAKTTVEA